MARCYFYLLSLLFVLLKSHWIDTASLRSLSRSPSKWSLEYQNPLSMMDNEVITSEPVLSRRRPQLTPTDRRRRWSIDGDNDEIEIPIDEISTSSNIDTQSTITEIKYPLLKQDIIEVNETTDELTTISSENKSIEINPTESELSATNIPDNNSTQAEILPTTITEINNQEISNGTISDNSTIAEIISNETETTSQTISVNQTIENETVTVNQTNETETASEAISVDRTIGNETVSVTETNETETTSQAISVDQTIGNETVSVSQTNETETTLSREIIEETSTIVQTDSPITDNLEQDTAIILLDYTTIPPPPPDTSDDNQMFNVSETQTISEYNTTLINEVTTVIQEEIDNNTSISDTTVNNVEVIDQNTTSNFSLNETSTIFNDENEFSNETISFTEKVASKPICDRSCQCLKECPYGFELVDDQCKCEPPCKNNTCFGNDTCNVTSKGTPLCQPPKGVEHDRPIGCYQPEDAGYHDVDMIYYDRWYYNPDQDKCHSFVYRGLGGNENNFQTQHACNLQCIICAPSHDRGPCKGFIPMWYYDHKKKQCLQFTHSGCEGNENKFRLKQQCIDTCITRIISL